MAFWCLQSVRRGDLYLTADLRPIKIGRGYYFFILGEFEDLIGGYHLGVDHVYSFRGAHMGYLKELNGLL